MTTQKKKGTKKIERKNTKKQTNIKSVWDKILENKKKPLIKLIDEEVIYGSNMSLKII